MEQVKVIAPAKINLSLDITGVDEKGYHLLDMIMQTVSVFEYVTLTKQDEITMASNAKFIPTDSKNTAVKAAMKFFEYTGIQGGVHIHIKKNVPIKAGMAGGSADAAGVIVGLNHMYGTKLTIDQMCEIGLMCGSDIPFMIHGGTKRIQGTGDIVLPCPQMPEYPLVICMPANGVSTPQAYANYDANGIKTLVETDKLVSAIKDKNLADIAKYMAAADVIICRCGALTIAELSCMGKAAILIPSPNVAENHQYYNGKVLSDIDAAILIEEKNLNEKTITDSFEKLYQNPQLIKDMGQRAKTAYNPRCVDIIYENLEL